MRYAAFVLLLLHGLIHLLGFAKAFDLGNISQLTKNISKPAGFFWMAAAILFLCAAVSLFLQSRLFWFFLFLAVVVSQVMIVFSWQDAKYGTIANIIFLLVAISSFASWKYHHLFVSDVESNFSQPAYFEQGLLTENDIVHLPLTIQQYIRYTKSIGKPKISNFKAEFTGQIRGKESEQWMPFYSEQYNFLSVPTRLFFMNATMKSLPVAGYHKYINANASMDIRLLSLFQVQYFDGAEMNTAETVTFLNDLSIMAPAALIDRRIQWEEVNAYTTNARFTVNNHTVNATLFFNVEGALIDFESFDRFNTQENKRMRWTTPIKAYTEINGYKLASDADLVYSYPNQEFVYGRFKMKQILYNTSTAK
ncbi:MAG: hypothetical protein QM725_15035 [Lacibacter sp.]